MSYRLLLPAVTLVVAAGLAGCAGQLDPGVASDATPETSGTEPELATPSPTQSPSPPVEGDALASSNSVDPVAAERAREALPDDVLPEGFTLVREEPNLEYDGVIHVYATDQYANSSRDGKQSRGPEIAVRVIPGPPVESANRDAVKLPEGAQERPDIAPGAVLYETPGVQGEFSLNIPVGNEEIIIASATAGEDVLITFAEAVLR